MEQLAGGEKVLMVNLPKPFCKDAESSQSASKQSGVELRCRRFGSSPCHPP